MKLDNFASELDESLPLAAEIAYGVVGAAYVVRVINDVAKWIKTADFSRRNESALAGVIQDIILKLKRDKLKAINFDQESAKKIAKKHKELGKDISNYLKAEDRDKTHFLSRMARYFLAMSPQERQEVMSLVNEKT